ncbi:CoA ester lyase [Haloarculaceae archaeon H-GB1-1]|nr:CoA ester lyase [Haloarculaceae archaeon H-GB1-1]
MARRSVLFSPGDRPEMLRKATTTDADVVVFDLEDAVAPARKSEAREAVASVLGEVADADCEVCVRVNSGAEAAGDLDVVLDGDALPDSVMLPKVADAGSVEALADTLAEHDAERPVLALVETARGVLNAAEIAAAEATDALVFGAEDLAADLGATRTTEGTEVLHAREHVRLAASAADVDAIDTLFTDFEDSEGLAEDAAFSRTLGFEGKLAIHPSQVPVINEAFTPDPERVEWAERVVAARDEAARDDRGVFQVDGEMIDAPLLAQADRILERARAAGIR